MKKFISILILLLLKVTILTGLTTSPVGVVLIQKYEGCRLSAYKCPAGVWTIGYGHTGSVKAGQRITKQMATAYLKYDLNRFEKYVVRTIPIKLHWYEFDALISFTFNLGYRLTGDLKAAILTKQHEIVVRKLRLYCKARVNGSLKELRGLVRRRNDEANLYQNYLNRLDFFSEKYLTMEQMREAVWNEE